MPSVRRATSPVHSATDAPTTPSRAAVYVRVSTLEQGEHGYSLDAQGQDCRRLAAELKAEVVTEFRDTDSGASWDLPGLNAMLDAAKRGDFDLLLVYDPDRLARRMAKQLVIEEELTKAGVRIQYCTLRGGDSAEDRLLKNVRSSIAEYEREKIALRTARGRRAKAEQGIVVGNGIPPLGYRYTHGANGRVNGLEPDPATAPIVQRIFADVVVLPTLELCRRLTAEGVPTYLGAKAWANSTILSIVHNPVYLGQAAYGRRDTNKRPRDPSQWLTAEVPPLVDRATWEAAHRALASRKSVRPARGSEEDDPYLLRGLLTCVSCGGFLACIPNNGYRYYKCLRREPARAEVRRTAVCIQPAVLATAIEGHIWERITATLLDPERLEVGLKASREQHEHAGRRKAERLAGYDKEIDRLRLRLGRITAERLEYERGSENERVLRGMADGIEADIQRLVAERTAVEAEPTGGISTADAQTLQTFAAKMRHGLTSATTNERRQVLKLLNLRATVQEDENGPLKVRRHRFTVRVEAALELQDVEQDNKKVRVRYYTPELDEWELTHLPTPATAR